MSISPFSPEPTRGHTLAQQLREQIRGLLPPPLRVEADPQAETDLERLLDQVTLLEEALGHRFFHNATPDDASVAFREGPLQVEDYDEAIEALQNARSALQDPRSGGSCCTICGDSSCSPEICLHNPLRLARLGARSTLLVPGHMGNFALAPVHQCRCFHCGFIPYSYEEARAHFGDSPETPATCRPGQIARHLKSMLERIRALCEGATRGPWSKRSHGSGGGRRVSADLTGETYSHGVKEVLVAEVFGPGLPETGWRQPQDPAAHAQKEANADFIALARDQVPWLVDQVEMLLRLLDSPENHTGLEGLLGETAITLLQAETLLDLPEEESTPLQTAVAESCRTFAREARRAQWHIGQVRRGIEALTSPSPENGLRWLATQGLPIPEAPEEARNYENTVRRMGPVLLSLLDPHGYEAAAADPAFMADMERTTQAYEATLTDGLSPPEPT